MLRAFKILRDLFIFTNRRLVLIDKQGITGRKAEYHSIPYKISGNPVPIVREFKKGTDIVAVQKTLAEYIVA